MVDYREEKRITPSGALIEINRLKQTGDLTGDKLRLLDNLENYVRTKFGERKTEKR